MRLLIDTHVFLWWVLDDDRLSPRSRELVGDGTNEILVSAASAYEMAFKKTVGRLQLPEPAAMYVSSRIRANRFVGLDVTADHALRAGTLPLIHRDPWDRVLVAQAQLEGISLITSDPAIARYDVEIIW